MSNKKEKKKIVKHNQECKKIIEGYLHFFLVARYETCLFMLTTISCNFKFVNTYISYDQITIHYSQCLFIFVYKITKDYNFLQENLL